MDVSKALAVWAAMMAAETLHGVARALLLAPLVSEFRARQAAVFTGSAIIFLIARRFYRSDGGSRAALAATGALWAALTVGFELSLGAALGLPRQRVVEDFDLRRGGLLGLGLLFMAACPTLVARGHGRHGARRGVRGGRR